MKKRIFFLGFAILLCVAPAWAHFGMLIPAKPSISKSDPKTIELVLSFSHPMEGVGMDMAKPKAFGVLAGTAQEDLISGLKAARVMGKAAWSASYTFKRPGVYIFHFTPEPYWEAAEDSFIAHYPKVVVPAFGEEEGWDREVGHPIEIVPLTRPFGLYAGNVFQGIVKQNGKPAPFAEVEIEFYNREGKAQPPTEYQVTQVVKADRNGVFTYAVPRPGWWGFAALAPAEFKLKKDGKDKAVEIGGVIWVYFHAWQEK